MPRFRLIDSSMTMHGFRFDMKGARMERFLENPVMLYMHARGSVYGRWSGVELSADAIYGEPEFDMEDEAAAKIAGKVERGFLKACSMGIKVINAEMVGDQPTITEWEPYECSIVDAGSNAHAVALYTPSDELIENVEEHLKTLQLSIMSTENKTIEVVKIPKEIALAVGLPETADESAIVSKVKELHEENKNLKLAAETKQKQDVKDLLDQAIADKKIKATDRTHYETLAAADFTATKSIIASLAAPVSLVDFANQGATNSAVEDDTEQLAAEYTRFDRSGKLIQLKASNPEKFQKLFEAKFGSKPS